MKNALCFAFAILVTMIAPDLAKANMTTVRVGSGFSSPVFLTAPDGDTERLFVVEQDGIIRVIKNGTTLPTPFLNWTTQVNSGGNEQGMLGMAFDPDFDTNGYVYVYYTAGSGAGRSVIRRFTVPAGADTVDTSTIRRVLRIEQTFTNHNGGHIEFGPDGFLYFGLGDGGAANDPNNAGQTGTTLLGKMIRIDPDGDDFPLDAEQNYAIPADNPFVGNPSIRDEIWSLGLRNPYRFAFDEANGDMYIGDVGQNCWEEITYEKAPNPGGTNHGWKIEEGNHAFSPSVCTNPPSPTPGLTDPIHEFSHSQDGFSCSVTGGRVYRGNDIPQSQGRYFFADFCSNQIYTFRYVAGTLSELTNRTAELDPPTGTISSITAFGRDGVGELYIVERGGEIWKIINDPKTSVETFVGKPKHFEMAVPNPNPFQAATTVTLNLREQADVKVAVYNASGRIVANLHDGTTPAGTFSVNWDGRDASGASAAAGVYFVRAISRGYVSTKSVTLLR